MLIKETIKQIRDVKKNLAKDYNDISDTWTQLKIASAINDLDDIESRLKKIDKLYQLEVKEG